MATTTDQKVVVKEMSWDPITRIVGSLGIHTEIDFTNRKVNKCYSTSMVFRGFDIFMKGIDPRDAHFITSRICGICGDNHCDLLVPVTPRTWPTRHQAAARSADLDRSTSAEAAEYMFDHNDLSGRMHGQRVDFCEQMVKETNPSVLATGREDRRRRIQKIHGYKTIADIMLVAESVHRRASTCEDAADEPR